MFNFWKRTKADVLNHWIAFADGFQLAPTEFYDAVERELKARQVPDLESTRVKFAEGGLLSDQRVYLRMLRERLIFDVCAAPFGDGFFFSCRLAELPTRLTFWQMLALVIVFGGLFLLLSIFLTPFIGPFVFLALVFLLVWVGRNALSPALTNIDAFILKLPAIGPFYDRYLRVETYYRQDTRLMYLEVVPGVVKKLAEDAAAAKGVKLVRQYEQAPVLGELYKRVPPPSTTDFASPAPPVMTAPA